MSRTSNGDKVMYITLRIGKAYVCISYSAIPMFRGLLTFASPRQHLLLSHEHIYVYKLQSSQLNCSRLPNFLSLPPNNCVSLA
jgi:hypothetical protein